MEYGDTCVNEYTKYKIRDQSAGLTCKDDAGTCKRALCECDKMFAELHANVADEYDEQYHIFDGEFEPEDECQPGDPNASSGGNGDPKVRCSQMLTDNC